jgi:CRISPR system Cascade subunit CasE
MTFLTRASLNFAAAARAGLRDSYDWHQAAWKAFPGMDGEQREYLTRLEQDRDGFRLLIVSAVKPVQPEWCQDDAGCWETKEIPEEYFGRRRYAFQLRANPTKKVTKLSVDGKPTKNGKRTPLCQRGELVAWLKRKGEDGGFEIEESSLRTVCRGPEYFSKRGERGVHHTVDFQGVLAVTDGARFHRTFTLGVGPAKAFGFGLLVIVPERRTDTEERRTMR